MTAKRMMKPLIKHPVIDVIRALVIGQDASFGPYVVHCYLNSRKAIAYRIECEEIIIARPQSIVTAAQFINNRWSRFFGERKL
jgi:hypothetical protein